jgi:XTP/dITP diphosphohydrolase
MRLYLASSNAGKLRELSALARAEGFELATVPGYERVAPFAENEPSFALNALEKALYYSRGSDSLVVADDSGLVVEALGGQPGVRSARYAGAAATDAENNQKLLEELRSVPAEKRGARFVCVLALAQGEKVLAIFSDYVEGRILEAPRGRGGFGYDPLFLLPERGCSSAELALEEKNRLSHRGKAFRKLLAFVRQT